MALNEKQQRFAEEYLVDRNATQAAKRAGYSDKTAYSIGQRLLKNVEIRAYIDEKSEEITEKTLVDVEYIILGLKEVAERCMQRRPVMEFNGKFMEQKKDDDGNNVWEFDSSGANRSLELLGRHKGVFEKDNGQKKAIIKVGYTNDDDE